MWPFGRREPLGRRGERLAARFLRRKGLKILGRNYACPGGEIDLIALERPPRREGGAETIVFVEVKTRSSAGPAAPQSAVDAAKKRRLRRAARHYLSRHRAAGHPTRYDVIAIVLPPDAKPDIRHIRGRG